MYTCPHTCARHSPSDWHWACFLRDPLPAPVPALSAPRTLCGAGGAVRASQVGRTAEAGGPGPQFFVALLLVFLLEACITILFFAYTDKVQVPHGGHGAAPSQRQGGGRG